MPTDILWVPPCHGLDASGPFGQSLVAVGCSAGTEVMAGHGFPAHIGGQMWHLWFPLVIAFCCLSLLGTSGELGGIRQIKIEPDELDIIQITVPGRWWGISCGQWPLRRLHCCVASRCVALRRGVYGVSPGVEGPPVHWPFFTEGHTKVIPSWESLGFLVVVQGGLGLALVSLSPSSLFYVAFPLEKASLFPAFLHAQAWRIPGIKCGMLLMRCFI